jgi:PDZ domain
MRYLIPSLACGRKTLRLVVKASLLCLPVLLAACATANRPAGVTQGYTEKQIGRNLFVVALDGNEHAPAAKAAELCLLRSAEVTLAYGFSHFVVLESASQPASSNRTMVSTSSPGGSLALVSSDGATLSRANTIACFRKQPDHYPQACEAQALFDRLSGKYGVRTRLAARANPMEASPLRFDLDPAFLFLSKTTSDKIFFLEPDTARRAIVIGGMIDWENPCQTLEEFKRKAAVAAATLGGQAVQIQSDSKLAQPRGPGSQFGFAAALLLVPSARLGIQNEAGDWPRTELIVQGFDKNSLAPQAGLKVGDRITALDGVDVRKQKRFADGWLSWTVGETVVVIFVRDGTEMSLQATTIAN